MDVVPVVNSCMGIHRSDTINCAPKHPLSRSVVFNSLPNLFYNLLLNPLFDTPNRIVWSFSNKDFLLNPVIPPLIVSFMISFETALNPLPSP